MQLDLNHSVDDIPPFWKEWPFPEKPPREVQLRALAKGYGKPGFGYFMRQRLGKTLTAFAEFTLLKNEGKVDWMIVICPNSIKETEWVRQIEEVNSYIPIRVYYSNKKKQTDYFFQKNKTGGVFIINHESVNAFMKNSIFAKFNVSRAYIVLDESIVIKEPTKKITKACIDLANICAYKRILTGKPVANSNADLWAQLKFINATERNFYQHKYTFCIMGGWQGKTIKKNINVEMLQREIKPYCYVAEDKFIKTFEKVYEPIRHIELTGQLKEMYEQMENDLIFELKEGLNITAPIALVKYLRLQQIGSGIAGDEDGTQHNLVDPEHNPRIKTVLDILDNEIDHKVIIPCRFRLSIDNLYKVLTKKGYKCLKMLGGMKAYEITDVKNYFNNGDYDVLIGQLQVLRFGHDLSGNDNNPTDSMIYFENDFSLINRDQSEKRIEKFGRKIIYSYYDMYISEMDKYILNSLIKKEDAAMNLMNYIREHGILGNKGEI